MISENIDTKIVNTQLTVNTNDISYIIYAA